MRSSSFLTPPTEERLDESRSALRRLSLKAIAEDPRFAREGFNSSLPGIGLHAPDFATEAIVVFARKILQLVHEPGILAALNFDEATKTGMRRMALGSPHQVRQAYTEGVFKSTGKDL